MADPIAEYQRQLAANADEARALAAGLDEERLQWRPEPGRWSIAECLAHLNTANALYLPAIDESIARARARGETGEGPFRYSWVSNLMVRAVEPPPKRKVRSPRAFVPPPGQPAAAILPAFLHLHDQLAARLEAAGGLDLARARVASPVTRLIRLNLGAAFALIAAHERRHLWQAREVRNHPSFPHA